jgi:uncharacterized protein YdeI (YjbR/CyaY-like superfamily)
MTTERMNPKVDAYLRDAKNWRKEMGKLRRILLGCQLTEEFKWGKPCYTFRESNIVIILPLKNYCALLFGKGALLKDANNILITAGENTQAARQIRFTTFQEIVEKESILKAYVHEAIEMEKAGLKVNYKKTGEFAVPEEFQRKLTEDHALKIAFDALTPGRQRGYLLYFSGAKQSKTRELRVKKCRPQILRGMGLNDPYRSMRK